MNSEQWSQRYREREYEHGREANLFLRREFATHAPSGRALDLACGEGRNAVWLAQQGWAVEAVDFCTLALERARELGRQRGVAVMWVEADLQRFEPAPGRFQLVVIAYLHLPGHERRGLLTRAARALARDGELFMVGHAVRNLSDGIGGPRDPTVLWNAAEIATELRDLGLVVDRAEEVARPYEGDDSGAEAVDVLLRARCGVRQTRC